MAQEKRLVNKKVRKLKKNSLTSDNCSGRIYYVSSPLGEQGDLQRGTVPL